MSKYSKELKLEVVKYCLEKCNSVYDASKKFNIPSATPIKRWIKRYKLYGIEGLIPKRVSYDGKFNECKRTIYRWKARYNGEIESLRDKSRRPHHHPNEHTELEIKLIKQYKKNNRKTG